jgi:hypothetical protein
MTRGRGERAASGLAVALVLALAVGVAGSCSGADDNDSASESSTIDGSSGDGDLGFDESAPDDAGGGGGGEEAADEAAADGSGAPGAAGRELDTVALAQDREVIRTGDLRVQVDDVSDAIADVRRIAGAAGGFVSHEEAVTDDRAATITVRVPTADFDGVRTDIADLGDVQEQTVQADDVTAEMVDVETRIESLRRSVARLQEMLGGSGDVAQLSAVEGELARREVELEAMLGQQRLLEDQVALATLTVSLFEDEAAPEPDDDAAGFRDGLRQGWVTLVDVGRAALAVVGFVLPWLIPALVVGVPLRWHLRRRSATPTPPATPTPTPADA